jgi:hypothetical protein
VPQRHIILSVNRGFAFSSLDERREEASVFSLVFNFQTAARTSQHGPVPANRTLRRNTSGQRTPLHAIAIDTAMTTPYPDNQSHEQHVDQLQRS